jgi:hypothetical protein
VWFGNFRRQVQSNLKRKDGTYVLHVFAHTRGTPAQWHYRTRTGLVPSAGSWGPWQSLNLDIASQHLLPVIWDQRLHLIWPVFKQISEKQSDQKIPPPNGGQPQPAPNKFWSVEFVMSQLSAGQWQPKVTLTEKAYFNTADSPLAFTLRAWQNSDFSLQLRVYFVGLEEAITDANNEAQTWEDKARASLTQESIHDPLVLSGLQPQVFTGSFAGSTASVVVSWQNLGFVTTSTASGFSNLLAVATLPMIESPLSIVQSPSLLPPSKEMDLSQEPTYALIGIQNISGTLVTPTNYGFSGQDLVYGNYTLNNPGAKPLWVLSQTSVELLGQITNPHIIVPSQELIFDSTDPFFVADPTRTYLVQPTFYTISSNPQEITDITYMSQWSTSYVFETFYHPYARTFLRELEIGGISQLMERNLQTNPQGVRGWTPAFNFQTLYNPQPPVAKPYPGAAPTPATPSPDPGETSLDFAIGDAGAYSLYNWEIFYHVPMFVASLLLQNQQFGDALNWLEYIFNPTDSSGGATPQRYWEMAPFNAMNANDWASQQVQNLLNNLAADTQQGISDTATTVAIQNWMQDPFDPHAIASTRISAYGKATVMKFLDTLIAWGDWHYNQYTAEMVSQAEQLYILADMVLGPQPQVLRPVDVGPGAAPITYASLAHIDAFSNALVNVENVIVAPDPPQAIMDGTAETPSLPQFPGNGNSLLFCIPPNDQLLAYWCSVAKRLYNIRHCLNLQGQPQPLPLYAPAINPLALIEAAGAGASFSSATPAAPIYRFAVYLQKAQELTNDVRAYGALILSALEKQDSETLAVLRASQELDIQTRLLDVKTQQVTEAQDQITALQNQQAVVQVRYNYYSTVSYINAWETKAIELQGEALILNAAAVILDMTSGVAHLFPTLNFGVEGFGGSPSVTASYGGDNIASSVAAWAGVSRGLAGILSEAAGMTGTIGGYQRRWDDWTLQKNLASAELVQIASQITPAQDRLGIAQKELAIQNVQISNAKAVSTFLTSKYTNAQLYNWMITQLTTVYAQAYQLAFSLALQAQSAYQYELGSQDTFIQFGYWDSQHKGLTAGESLMFDLRRMEAQYIAENTRELELTKHVSLALTAPTALVMLRETGSCQIALDEALFEYDHPGHYFRRLRSVAVTIPCVTGPYTGVNATLTLTNAMVRNQSPGTSYQPQPATAAPTDNTVVNSPVAAAGTQTIVTSSGQNDSGLFEVNLRDDRWLPFEGQGAISTWNVTLDPRDNNFDLTTITDFILHLRYTARGAGDQTAAANVRAQLKPTTARCILVSVRNTFPNWYYTFFNPLPAATGQTLTLPLTNNVFPYSNLGHGGVAIQNLTVYIALSVSAAANTMPATFSGSPNSISLAPMPGQTAAGGAIEALTASIPFAPSLTAPQTFTMTIASTDFPAALATVVNGQTLLDSTKFEDILLVITYQVI